jgi:MYXO-CTERM domain-containing protein
MRNARWLTLAVMLLPGAARADIVNGSFETGDYTGWTLTKDAGNAEYATFGVAATGQMIQYGGVVHDFRDGVDVTEYSSSLPMTSAPTDGGSLAVQLQNGPATTRMYQTITIPVGSTLSWDLAYHNTWTTFASTQRARIDLRDPDTDAVLVTLFETKPGDPLKRAMTHYDVDVGAYGGRDVRLDVALDVQSHFLDFEIDRIVLTSPPPAPSPPPAVTPAPDDPEPQPGSGGCAAAGGERGGLALFGLALALGARRRRPR